MAQKGSRAVARGSRGRRWRRCGGFSLPDVIIGTVASILVILSSLRLLIDSYQIETSTRETVMACNAARQVVENLRAIKDARFAVGTYPDARTFGPVPQLGGLRNPTIGVVVYQSVGKAKKAAVTITWTSAVRDRPKTWKLVTLIGPGGISL